MHDPLRGLAAAEAAALAAERGWRAAQARLAKLSTRSVQRTVPGATHAGLLEDERYAAIAGGAITQVVRRVRSPEQLP